MHEPIEQAGRGRRIGIMHLLDTLDVGGAERMAVNVVNALPTDRYDAHLCTTRRLGPLLDAVAPHVGLTCLHRRGRFDLRAIRELVRYVRAHDVAVLHAHGAAVFVAILAARVLPEVSVVWHIHFGKLASTGVVGSLLRILRPRIDHAIAVSQPLMSWARVRLGFGSGQVSYIPNFVAPRATGTCADLPGVPGERIVSVANFVREKGHTTLISAMRVVVQSRPSAHLLLVGNGGGGSYERSLRAAVARHGLGANVTFLGQRRDVRSILDACDVGVLSSDAEGLPLALVEYGAAGLPVVVTDVGQCADVVAYGEAGMLVPPGQPEPLAAALLRLVTAPREARELGDALRQRVSQKFAGDRIVRRICALYDRLVDARALAVSR